MEPTLPNGRPDPTVTVVVPVYRATYLSPAIESVFAQTRPPDAVILVDDGSPDRDALSDVMSRWGRRVILLSQLNSGAGAARNLGVLRATSEFVAFLDADDTWLPNYLETQLRVAAAHPECDVVYSDALFVGRTPLAGRRFMDVCPSRGEVTSMALLSLQCQIPLSATMVRRQAVLDVGLFDAALRRGQDFDLWLRLALAGIRFAHHRTVLMHHRIHDDNLSGGLSMRLERATSVFNKAVTQLPLTPDQREVARRQIRQFEAELSIERGKELLAKGDFVAARTALTAAQQVAARWKVHAALIALRVAPHLLRRVYLARA